MQCRCQIKWDYSTQNACAKISTSPNVHAKVHTFKFISRFLFLHFDCGSWKSQKFGPCENFSLYGMRESCYLFQTVHMHLSSLVSLWESLTCIHSLPSCFISDCIVTHFGHCIVFGCVLQKSGLISLTPSGLKTATQGLQAEKEVRLLSSAHSVMMVFLVFCFFLQFFWNSCWRFLSPPLPRAKFNSCLV